MGPSSPTATAPTATAGVIVAAETKKNGYSDDVIAGAVAGAVARLVSAPFDVLKIRFQLQFAADKRKYTSMLQAISTVTKEEGFLSLWKGNLSATYLWITYSMVQFSVYGWLKNVGLQTKDPFLGSRFAAHTNLESKSVGGKPVGSLKKSAGAEISNMWRTVVLFLAGAGAGLIATSTTYPFDIMRTQFAVQGSSRVFPTMHSFIKNTLETKGVRGFYVGLTPALIGITPYMGLNFALYESFSLLAGRFERRWRELKENGSNGILQLPGNNKLMTMSKNALCGGVAGGLSKFLVYPLDTIKKRLQMQSLTSTLDGAYGSVPRYSGIIDIIRKTIKSEGIVGFYKGIGPTTAKAIVSTAVTFAAFEGAKDFLEQRRKRVGLGNKHSDR